MLTTGVITAAKSSHIRYAPFTCPPSARFLPVLTGSLLPPSTASRSLNKLHRMAGSELKLAPTAYSSEYMNI